MILNKIRMSNNTQIKPEETQNPSDLISEMTEVMKHDSLLEESESGSDPDYSVESEDSEEESEDSEEESEDSEEESEDSEEEDKIEYYKEKLERIETKIDMLISEDFILQRKKCIYEFLICMCFIYNFFIFLKY
jgi:hypothetical protein